MEGAALPWPGAPRGMTMAEVQEMRRAGIRFGYQTKTHPVLLDCTPAQLRDEVTPPEALAELIGSGMHRWFAYPKGKQNPVVIEAVRQAGFSFGFTVLPGFIQKGDTPLRLRRFAISGVMSLLDFALMIQGGFLILEGPRKLWRKLYATLFLRGKDTNSSAIFPPYRGPEAQ